MNPKHLPLLFFFTLAAALYLLPSVAAQDTSIITDGLSNLWNTLNGYGAQIQQFITDQPTATAALAGTGTAAGIGATGWKLASTAKSKLQSAYNSLTGQLDSVQQKADGALEQLSAYKSQAETQLSSFQSQAETATQQATEYKNQLSNVQHTLTDKLTEVQNQKANLQNQVSELSELVKKYEAQLQVLTPKVK